MDNTKKGNIWVIILVLIIVTLVVVFCLDYFGFIKLPKRIEQCDCNCKTELCDKNNSRDDNNTEILNILQKRYNEIYNELQEGANVSISNKVNGKYVLEWDFRKLKKFFTENGIQQIKDEFSGEVDGYYYQNDDALMNTIFGVTDQKVRDLKLLSYRDDVAVLYSKHAQNCIKQSGLCVGNGYGNELIIFKNVDGTWYVDMFE